MANDIEYLMDGTLLLAVIIRSGFSQSGIRFFTPDNFSQQLGYMKREQGYEIAPHRHNLVVREIKTTQEVLFVRAGKVRIDFYNNQEKYLQSRILVTGDVILLADGGHGFEMIEESEIIEVKQGPYCGEKDKVRFESTYELVTDGQ